VRFRPRFKQRGLLLYSRPSLEIQSPSPPVMLASILDDVILDLLCRISEARPPGFFFSASRFPSFFPVSRPLFFPLSRVSPRSVPFSLSILPTPVFLLLVLGDDERALPATLLYDCFGWLTPFCERRSVLRLSPFPSPRASGILSFFDPSFFHF